VKESEREREVVIFKLASPFADLQRREEGRGRGKGKRGRDCVCVCVCVYE
jgi:hypothetical protein